MVLPASSGKRLPPRDTWVIDEAEFFFSPATLQWLKIVRADCEAFLEANAARREGRGDPARHADLQHELFRHFRAMPGRFRDDMSFRQLTDPS